jgi:hypothetical protein
MTDGVIGWQMWFVIAIDPDYADDEGLYQHELTHVKQWAAVTLAAGIVLGLIWLCLWRLMCTLCSCSPVSCFIRRYSVLVRGKGFCPARRSFILTTGR